MSTSATGNGLGRASPVPVRPPVRGRALCFAAAILAAIFAIAFGWAFFRTSPEPAVRFVVTFSEGQEPTIGAGTNVALSPDGSRLIYTGLSQLWQRQLNELEPSPIPGTEGARNPALSPDGMSVAFTVQSPRSIKTVSLLGARPITIVWVERDGSEREIDPSWTGVGVQGLGSLALSPDARRLALSVQEGEGS